MNVLVTGAGGLIGSYSADLLKKNGYHLTYLYREGFSSEENFVFGDLTKKEFVDGLSVRKPHIIVHCAAVLPGLRGSTIQTAANFNSMIDENIINFCLMNNCKLIYLSGTSVYKPTNFLNTEETLPEPRSEYVMQKYYSELKIIDKLKDYIILRVSAPYGPKQQSNTVLKKFICQALKNEPLEYFGTGSRCQDFSYIDDVANAVLLSAKTKEAGIFNIASGRSISMAELAKLVLSLLPESKSKILASGINDPEEGFEALYDISKAKRVLDWMPKISLEKGISEFISYLKQNN